MPIGKCIITLNNIKDSEGFEIFVDGRIAGPFK